jgi:hypothetical protein
MQANSIKNLVFKGFFWGIIIPIPTFFLIALIMSIIAGKPFIDFIKVFWLGENEFKSAVLSLAVIANGLLALRFFNQNQIYVARGVIASIFIYAIIILFLKLS